MMILHDDKKVFNEPVNVLCEIDKILIEIG